SETFFRKGIFDRLRSLAPNAEDLAALDRVLDEYHRAHPVYEITSESLPGRSTHLVAGRIAWAFDLHGPNITIDAACASSLAAIDCAVNSLRAGECDAVITGGVDTWMTADAFVLFSKVTALGREGSFPFDRRADGFILGEGCGLVVLKRYLDAVAQGDKIYAVISGVGSSSDGAGVGITAPQSRGQIKAVERAYRDGCLEPDRTVYVECHGTGTGLGDPTEITSLDTFYGRPAKRSLRIGSAKASVGHLRTAAGMAGLYSALLPLNSGLLPPQVNFETPSDALRRTQGRVSVQSSPDELETGGAQVAVSGFGFGGTNFHLVLSPADIGRREPLVDKSRFSQPLLPGLKSDVAFLFPGQGSQYVGMLEELRDDPTLAEYFRAADRVVEEVAGLNLLKALYPGSDCTDAAAGIRNTVLAQPAILTVSAALFRLVSNQGILPSLMVGHSLGEYTALYAAGAVGFEAAIRAVTLRGRIMSENPSGEESSLLCLLGPRHKALAVCERFAPRLEAANFNSYEQLVVAGPADLLRQAADFAEEIGLRASPLKVDRGFHSSFVKHTIAPMREHLETLDWVLPSVPIPANSARQFYPFERDQEKELRGKEKERLITLLSTQISAPVDFVSQIELAYEAGIRRFVEVGPRSVLSGLVDEILQGKKFQCVSLDRSNRSLYERVAELPTTLQAPLTFQRRPPARCRARNIHGTERLATSQAQSPEERVRAVVAGVSGYAPDQLPLDAEFEELGLDSLKLVEIVARLRGNVLPAEHRGFRGLTSIRKILDAANGGEVHRAPGKTRCFQVVSSLVPDLKRGLAAPSDWRCSLWEHPASGQSFTDSAANQVVLATLPSRLELHQRFLPFLLTSIQTQAQNFPGSRFALATVAGSASGGGGEKALTAFLRSAARDVPSLRFSYHHFESPDFELENALSDERVGITVTKSGECLHETLVPAGLTHEVALSDFLDENDLILVSGGARG
ncbi:MAG: acyltransferase domain-containing protein, partial [Candidatus Eremiobacteraeota bacterium]|nr:acyltransferase domain-containing protein [Candidatus Eremiobacteraeota bacterium]